MRVQFLTRYDERGASSRCRVYQYLPFLAAQGISAAVMPRLPGATALGRLAGSADAVFLQKRLLTLPRLLLLRWRAPALLFDFDDALWLRRRRNNTVCLASPRTRLRLAAALRLADHVIAGNDYLGAYARRWNPRVTVLPTPVDGEYYGAEGQGSEVQGSGVRGQGSVAALQGSGVRGQGSVPAPAPGSFLTPDPSPLTPATRLGWVGHASNLCYLRALEPALAALARRHPGLTLRVVCSEPYASEALPVENVSWSLDAEVTNLRSFDIGLMPLEEDPWTLGKCGYKALQYMAVGVPVVCSPVGMNAEIVTEGQTGLLAANPAAWEQQLARLIESPELRRQLGAAGREAALQRYTLSRMAPRLAEVIRAVSPKDGKRADGAPTLRD